MSEGLEKSPHRVQTSAGTKEEEENQLHCMKLIPGSPNINQPLATRSHGATMFFDHTLRAGRH